MDSDVGFISHAFTAILTAIVTAVIFMFCAQKTSNRNNITSKKLLVTANKQKTRAIKEKRQKQTNQQKRIINVTENVYAAIGYGLANCIVIQGNTAWINVHIKYYNCQV